MDFAVAAARQVAQAVIVALTAAPGDAVDPADPRDTLAPSAWTLAAPAGSPAPRVRRVVPAEEQRPPSRFRLELDAPLTPGVAYQLALAPLARAAYGQPTSAAAVPLVGRTLAHALDAAPGQPVADVALPVSAPQGQPVGLAPLPALRERLERLAATAKGKFTHAPEWGRGVEPKRTYSEARLAQEAAAQAAALRADPDVARAEVRVVKGRDGVTRFEYLVEPAVGGAPVSLSRLVAGGEP